MSELKIKKELYNVDVLTQACNDYAGIAAIQWEDLGIGYRVKFADCRYPVGVTIGEFENYLYSVDMSQARISGDYPKNCVNLHNGVE